ncbi:hypothetical protein [Escherichia phage vB_EcoP_YF01]|uniref:Uncharacterized protein n=1 Tax=Escherichia phage vB_EcoP_YF01 TaxID=3017283 RepID=A0AAE9VTY2_9CAUD|nr:hypothetical protein [Escherichia phage vB_EcoP_YF01]
MNKYKVLFKDTNAAGEMRAMDIDADYFRSELDQIVFYERGDRPASESEAIATFGKESICGVIKIFITE